MPQLFRILDFQIGPGENRVMNRYWYDNPGSENATATNVANAFIDTMVELLRIVQSNEYRHEAVFVENVLNPAQSALVNITDGFGLIGGDSSTAFSSWSYALKPVGPTIKRGAKRIPGIPESWTDSDVVLAGTPTTALNGFAAAFRSPIAIGPVTINPAIVRPNQPVNPTSWLTSVVVASAYRSIGTQVSRKLGRGSGSSLQSIVPFNQSTATVIDRSGFVEADAVTEINTLLATMGTAGAGYEVSRS